MKLMSDTTNTSDPIEAKRSHQLSLLLAMAMFVLVIDTLGDEARDLALICFSSFIASEYRPPSGLLRRCQSLLSKPIAPP